MIVARTCTREAVYIDEKAGVIEVARIMREEHVGSVIVVDADGRPTGIITDRDLVIEILAEDVDMDSVLLKDIMTTNLVVVTENEETMDAIEKMRDAGIRRAPVVDDKGYLSGLLSVDDVLTSLGEEIKDIITLINKSRSKEALCRQ